MKTKKYLKDSYQSVHGDMSQNFKLSEAYFIVKILKEQAIDNKVEVNLIECDEKQYKLMFG